MGRTPQKGLVWTPWDVDVFLGVREIDRKAKVIRVSPSADLPLEWCEGTLPLSRDEVAVVKWRRDGDGLKVDVKLPAGWRR